MQTPLILQPLDTGTGKGMSFFLDWFGWSCNRQPMDNKDDPTGGKHESRNRNYKKNVFHVNLTPISISLMKGQRRPICNIVSGRRSK